MNTFGAISRAMTSKTFIAFAISMLGTIAIPPPAAPHDGKLDSYGCHYSQDHKDYHCHEGTFKGVSFESKIAMIRQLKLQFLNLGQPWPYDSVAEEDITSAETQRADRPTHPVP